MTDQILTERELRLTGYVAEGMTNRDIAPLFSTTEYVLKNHLRIIYDKTGLGNRVELALWYLARQDEATAVALA